MLQKSRWVFHINNMFMNEDLTAQIEFADDGSFQIFAVKGDGTLKPFPEEVAQMITFDGSTFSAEIKPDELKGMKFKVEVTFYDDTAEGFFKVPIMGKMKFKGERIEIPQDDSTQQSEEAAEQVAE